MRKGFTLIEMSIVLVIIGVLAAGVLVGQSLIRSSNLQTIISDVAGFKSAITQFRQKYNAVPGDMPNAQSYWGVNPNCTTTGGTGSGTQTCNGNSDGHITLSSSAPYEQFLVWQHLANGGFISGQYIGTSASGTGTPTVFCSSKVNCPNGKASQTQAYFLQYSAGALGSDSYYWDQPSGHYLIVGAVSGTSGYPAYPLFTAAEAYSLDSKVDDGLPGMGAWKSFEAVAGGTANYIPNCVVISGTTNPPTNGTITYQPTSVYYVAYGTKYTCSFEINMGF